MSYLLDTNVIGELRKPAGRAAPAVRAWAPCRPAGKVASRGVANGVAAGGPRPAGRSVRAKRRNRTLLDRW